MMRIGVAFIIVSLLLFASTVQARDAIVLCPDNAIVQPHPCGTRQFIGAGKLKISWEGGSITFQKKIKHFVRRDRAAAQQVLIDCVFVNLKTKCVKSGHKVGRYGADAYGAHLRYASPIASEIPLLNPSQEAEAHQDRDEWHMAAEHMSSLGPLTPRSYSVEELKNVPEVKAKIAAQTEDTAYFYVDDVIGGEAAVESWKSLIGRLPQKGECDSTFPCSVVLEGKLDDFDVIAYCSILKSAIGIGTPYNCAIPVLISGGKTYVLSYAGPEQCECGAGAGASCNASSDTSLDEVVSIFVAEMKAAKTNIDMVAIRRSPDEVVLSGKHVGKNSKFFRNYFEKAYAYYTISARQNDFTKGKREIAIQGLYNLLISSEPSPDKKDYRDFGKSSDQTSDLAWLQEQVLDIIRKRVMAKIGSGISCGVIDVDE